MLHLFFIAELLGGLAEAKSDDMTLKQLQHFEQPYAAAASNAIKRQKQLSFLEKSLAKKEQKNENGALAAEFKKILDLYRGHLQAVKTSLDQTPKSNNKSSRTLYNEALMTLKQLESAQGGVVSSDKVGVLNKVAELHRLISAIENFLHGKDPNMHDLKEYAMPSEQVMDVEMRKPLKGESLPIKPLRKADGTEYNSNNEGRSSIPIVVVKHNANSDPIERDR